MSVATLSLISGAAQAGELKLDPTSSHGLIAVEVDAVGPLAAHISGYTLSIRSFSPTDQTFTSNAFRGLANIYGIHGLERAYYLVKAKPGIYAFASVRDRIWGACYNDDSQAFDVKAGQVTFVGLYSARQNFIDMRQAIQDGRMPNSGTSNSSWHVFDTPRLALSPAESQGGWQSELEGWLKEKHPAVKGPVTAAELTATTFKNSRFGVRTNCG